MRVHRQLPKVAPEHPLRWLYRIADNHCFDVLKRRKWSARSAQETERALRDWSELPDERAPDSQRFLTQVLASCRPQVRDTAVLYFVDQLTQDEIAQSLGCCARR